MNAFRKFFLFSAAAALIMLLAACDSKSSKNHVYPTSTATPEMLIVRHHPTETPKTYSDFEIYMTQAASGILPQKADRYVTPTPTYKAPVYDGSNNLIGYVGDPTQIPTQRSYLSSVYDSSVYEYSEYSSSCNIKGNVNSNGERIYHCPGWRDYDRTMINPDEGDTYFCSEAAAIAAGFRDPDYPHGTCR